MSEPSNERSCTVTTERPRQPSGRKYWKCASCGCSRPSSRGSDVGHPRLGEPRGQLDRLDALGNQLGMPRDRGELEVGRDAGQLPEQVLDVGLVARALPAENVGVDQDHATSA